MKKFLLGTVALVAFAAPAAAADLAARPYTKAPAPMIAALYDWSGFYIGANGGWGSSRKCWDVNNNGGGVVAPAAAEGCHDATGGVAGGQIGYRWQAGTWVFGLEAQGNWADLSGSEHQPGLRRSRQPFEDRSLRPVHRPDRLRLEQRPALREGRRGRDRRQVSRFINAVVLGVPAGTTFDRASETRWGGVVGVGLEYGFSPNWSMAVEYDHLFMGDRNVTMTSTGTFVPVGALSRIDNISQDVDLVTVRVNYRWGGPVIAKY